MTLLLTFILIGLVAGFLLGFMEDGPVLGIGMSLFFGFIGAILSFVFFGIVAAGGWQPNQERTAELMTMNDGSNTQSVYFLASGGSFESPDFSFYAREADTGAMWRRTVDASSAEVFYTDDTPTVSWNQVNQTRWWIFPYPRDIEFYVPEGSIMTANQYELDNE